MPKGYRVVRKYAGNPVYGCNKCSFVSMKEQAIAEHVRSVHAKPKKNPILKVPVDDGVPIRDMITAPMKKEE